MNEVSDIAAPDVAKPKRKAGANRRMGAAGSETWSLLLDTAETMMREKGYAAITSRQLASESGLSPQIVYFYFRTMDDLFEALFKRLADSFLVAIDEVRGAKEPLLAMWEMSCDPSRAVIMSELISLSHHRKGLRSLISDFGVEYNWRQAVIIEAELAGKGVDLEKWPPTVVASILENLAKSLAFGVGFDIPSHNNARVLVTQLLRNLVASGRS